MIFFNGRGWEVGGLTQSTRTTETGYSARRDLAVG